MAACVGGSALGVRDSTGGTVAGMAAGGWAAWKPGGRGGPGRRGTGKPGGGGGPVGGPLGGATSPDQPPVGAGGVGAGVADAGAFGALVKTSCPLSAVTPVRWTPFWSSIRL